MLKSVSGVWPDRVGRNLAKTRTEETSLLAMMCHWPFVALVRDFYLLLSFSKFLTFCKKLWDKSKIPVEKKIYTLLDWNFRSITCFVSCTTPFIPVENIF